MADAAESADAPPSPSREQDDLAPMPTSPPALPDATHAGGDTAPAYVPGPYSFGHVDGAHAREQEDLEPGAAEARARARMNSSDPLSRSDGGARAMRASRPAAGLETRRSLPSLSTPAPPPPPAKGDGNKAYLEGLQGKSQRSYMGHIPTSNMRSAANMKFTQANRFGYEHTQYLSKEHCAELLPDWTPGPGTYPIKGSVGKQVLSTKPDKGTALVTSGKGRFDNKFLEHAPPGVGRYNVRLPQLGKRVESKERNVTGITTFSKRNWKLFPEHGTEHFFYCQNTPSPIYDLSMTEMANKDTVYATSRKPAFGKGIRKIDPARPNTVERRARAIPGPGAYDVSGIADKVIVDTQLRESKRKGKPVDKIDAIRDTSPKKGFSMGTQNRVKAGEVSLSPAGAQSVLSGREGQGPATYTLKPSVGRQVQSYKKSAPSSSFSKTSRFSQAGFKADSTPGPGTYCV